MEPVVCEPNKNGCPIFHLSEFFYSPELNPDKQVWNRLKEKSGKAVLKTEDESLSFIRGKMKSLQKSPEILRGFFKLYDVNYASRQCYVQYRSLLIIRNTARRRYMFPKKRLFWEEITSPVMDVDQSVVI